MFTLAWIFTDLPGRQRLTGIVGGLTAFVLVLEVGIIDTQAARGVTSHFNVGTPLDAALFGIMGLAILVRRGRGNRADRRAVPPSVLPTVHSDGRCDWGCCSRWLGQGHRRPDDDLTGVQRAAARTSRPTVFGAHTVGAPDGGPGAADYRMEPRARRPPGPTFRRAPCGADSACDRVVIGPLGLGCQTPASRPRRWRRLRGPACDSAGTGAQRPAVLAPRGLTLVAFAVWLVAIVAGALFVFSAPRDKAADRPLPVLVSE